MKKKPRKRSQTDNRGAADVRAVLAKIERMIENDCGASFVAKGVLAQLRDWLKSQTKRTRARKGGL